MRLPYAAGTFDLVIAVGVFEYVFDPAAFLSGVARVLRPGGRFLVTTPNPLSPAMRLELAIHGLAQRTRVRPADDYFHDRPTPSRMRELLEAAGFDVAAEAFANFLPYNLALRLPGSSSLDAVLARMARLPGLGRTGASYLALGQLPA